MKNTKELRIQLMKDIASAELYRNEMLKNHSLVDNDGYPTNACLLIISKWHWSDSTGWFKFIKEQWYNSEWVWKSEQINSYHGKVMQYSFSTIGWSGNEEIVRAMQDNVMMWNLTWVQSRRGGHYIFEDRVFDFDVSKTIVENV